MAKLGKQKFNLLGEHNSSRTTFRGTIELYLHYNTDKDFFYFEEIELKKYLPNDSVSFAHCKTKEQALNVIEILVSNKIKETRKLRVEIGMNSELYKVLNPKYEKTESGSDLSNWRVPMDMHITNPEYPQYLQDMLQRGGAVYGGAGLTLNFHRIMELELNGEKLYVECDKDWKYERKHFSGHDFNLIDWTPQAEKFLIETQEKLTNLCQMVLKFFNAGDDIQSLFKKMESNIKMLE
jgi:hypothetical protein